MRTRIKICCISSVEEAKLAIRSGADALGLVSAMPSGPGVITEDLIAEIAPTVPPPVATFLLTSETEASAIVAQQRRGRVNTIQICDRVSVACLRELREALPGVSLVQVVHVMDDESVAEAVAVADKVDAILLDSGNQNLVVKELGGTGRKHDWRLSRKIVESVPVPVFLAGGLNPENVAEAIQQAGPYSVDICSGVRTAGKLDEQKLLRFIRSVASVVR